MAEKITVWTYWHSEERPAIVNDCIASWRRHLDSKKFKIIVLSERNLSEYLSPEWINQVHNYQDLHKAGQADFIRLSLLKLYGGIWLDASIYLLQNFSFIRDFKKFYAPRIPVLDAQTVQTWFLVAPKNDYIISKWLKLYINVLNKKYHLEHRWYRIRVYTLDNHFKTYFKVYSVYAHLYRVDSVFRKNTPKCGEYNSKTRYNMGNFIKILRILVLKKLNMNKKAIMYKNAIGLKNQIQFPSITLMHNNELVFYKMNSLDRESIKDIKALR